MKSVLIVLSFFLTLNISAQMDSTSYSVGMIIAQNLIDQGITELNQESFNAAVADVLGGKETKVTKDAANATFQKFAQEAKIKASMAHRVKGEKFLKENGMRKEVTTTASGLQYEVLEESGSTTKPKLTDKVNVHYHGTLTDGTVFDSSVERGEPISFPLNGVITGWQEGLQLMTVGSKYRLFIPYSLAYGDRAAGPTIKAYSALIFDVQLLAIE